MILWVAGPVMFTLRLGFTPIACRVFTIPSIRKNPVQYSMYINAQYAIMLVKDKEY